MGFQFIFQCGTSLTEYSNLSTHRKASSIDRDQKEESSVIIQIILFPAFAGSGCLSNQLCGKDGTADFASNEDNHR